MIAARKGDDPNARHLSLDWFSDDQIACRIFAMALKEITICTIERGVLVNTFSPYHIPNGISDLYRFDLRKLSLFLRNDLLKAHLVDPTDGHLAIQFQNNSCNSTIY